MSVWKEKEAAEPNASGLKKRSSAEAGLAEGQGSELADTASSPLKPVAEEQRVANPGTNTKKQLLLEATAHIDAADMDVPPPPPAYVTPREQKKQRKTDRSGVETRTQTRHGAGSEAGRRQPE
jgi:hypothetical protein